jgi:sugar-specific transcriptional regulator TrmB
MQNTKTINSLIELGLDREEAEIYLYLTKVGSNKKENTAFAVGKNLGIPRSSVYLYIERLVAKDLISPYKINNKKHFLAENPNRIEKNLDKKKEILGSILEDIKSLAENQAYDFSTRVYRGQGSLEKVYDEIFDKKEMTKYKNIYVLTNTLLSKLLPKNLPSELDKIKKINNIYTKMILIPDRSDLGSYFQTDSHREVRALPEGSIFNGSMYIYGDKIALFSLEKEDPLAMIIESKTIVQMVKSFFLCTWELLGKK